MNERSLVLLDNDLLFKAAAYSLSGSSRAIFDSETLDCQILSSAKYVLSQLLKTKLALNDLNKVKIELESLLNSFAELDLNDAELHVAAALEQLAISHNLEFDAGESQLLAVRIARGQGLLVTGDKRAISSIEMLFDHVDLPKKFVACFEQFVVSVLLQEDYPEVRSKVCANARADKAIAICFSCNGSCKGEADVIEALNSYINHLRKSSARILTEGTNLSCAVP